jgi:hypothetical protein
MITSVTIRNLKQFETQVFDDLGRFHLLVGQNNSGKSTLLHALAIWNFCVEEFRDRARRGSTGTQIVLPNFTPLPLPSFKLLWYNTTERRYEDTQELTARTGKPKKRQVFIPIIVDVAWRTAAGETHQFAVELRYDRQQSVFAKPGGGWARFRELDADGDLSQSLFPRVVYVPPTSNIEPVEPPMNEASIRGAVGKGQPGSVVRNMLLRTAEAEAPAGRAARYSDPFERLHDHLNEWFAIDVGRPRFRPDRDRYIGATYRTTAGVELDWVNAGSGSLQALIVLSFLYGFQPDVLLLDEPDAHLHVNLQRTLLSFLRQQPEVQMLVATHAEEFIRRVDTSQITFLTPEGPKRIDRKDSAILALSEISNLDLLNLINRKLLVYVEGETDEELLRAWAEVLALGSGFDGLRQAMTQVAFVPMGGGDAETMKERADRHFRGAKLLSADAERVMVLDRNQRRWDPALEDNPVLRVWRRRHIENYLLNPEVWKRAAGDEFPLLSANLVDQLFREQGFLSAFDWLSDTAEVLLATDAKRLLFDAREERGDGFDALNARLYQEGIVLTRADVARAMRAEEIHPDVRQVLALIQEKAGISG